MEIYIAPPSPSYYRSAFGITTSVAVRDLYRAPKAAVSSEEEIEEKETGGRGTDLIRAGINKVTGGIELTGSSSTRIVGQISPAPSAPDTRYVTESRADTRARRQHVSKDVEKSANERYDVCKNGLPVVSDVYSRTPLTREYKRPALVRAMRNQAREIYFSFLFSRDVLFVRIIDVIARACVCV